MSTVAPPAKQYVKDNEWRARYHRKQSELGRDIGPPPDVVNPARRAAAEFSFRLFCESYHPGLFHRAWSPDHLKAIEKIEKAVLEGGQFAFAFPRGSGKTTLCYIACEWALLYAHRKFVVLIGAESQAANELLDAIRTDLENNEFLLEDFPKVVYPIQKLEGISHRCNGQTSEGQRTQMTWKTDQVVFPTIQGSNASGSTLKVVGITGRIRGMLSKTPEGQSIRPDLVIIDDPQTDESSRSVSQNDTRERTLAGAVLGLGGPGEAIAALMPCTVIRNQDMADRILNRDRHPEWKGERAKLVYEWPVASKKWEEYADIWAADLRNDGDGSVATEFYLENREEMDAGSRVMWPERFRTNEVSAIQHAWNLRLTIGEEAFASEYQNEPTDLDENSRPISLTADDLTARVSKVARGVVPQECDHLTAFIDISDKCLWWCLLATGGGFTGSVIDYGVWPEQHQRYVRLHSITRTLQRRYPGHGLESAISRGLEDLVEHLMQEWRGETGLQFTPEKILIDEGDGQHTDIVRNFCRRSDHRGLLLPAKGRGIKASAVGLCQGRRKKGERYFIYSKLITNRDQTRTVHVDVNYWKTFAMRRLEVLRGNSGAIDLYKQGPRHHQMFADQVTAETPKEVLDVGTGNRVIEWTNPRNQDNHLFDCLVGCCAAASLVGCRLRAQEPVEPVKRKRKKVSYL